MTSISPQTTIGIPPTTNGTASQAAPSGSAVLDSAHVGDIVGAFGRIRMDAAGPGRSWWQRLRMLMVITGPGLIVMVGDNDAGGVATYAQAGQNYRLTLLWTLVLLVPVLIVNQEMVVRLGAVTGVGHAHRTDFGFASAVASGADQSHVFSAPGPAPAVPADRDRGSTSDDGCPICASIALASRPATVPSERTN